VISRHVPAGPPDPNAPNAFRFADLGALASILTEAGASDVRDRVLHFQLRAPVSAEQFWNMRSETSDTLRAKLATLAEAEKTQVAQEIHDAIREFFPNDQMDFPAQLLIITGRKPA
jgi:hypothetical protein